MTIKREKSQQRSELDFHGEGAPEGAQRTEPGTRVTRYPFGTYVR